MFIISYEKLGLGIRLKMRKNIKLMVPKNVNDVMLTYN